MSSQAPIYPRFVEARLIEATGDSPVVLIHGPRQSGKTTLARMFGDARGYAYHSFDDEVVLSGARNDPKGFVEDSPDRVVLDEVQRVPELFGALKAAVDRDRRPGRFVLTGSANVLLTPRLPDSLAGRLAILRLHPLSQAELRGQPPGFLDDLFNGAFKLESRPRLGQNLAERVAAGGFAPALERPKPARQMAWYRDYITTLVQRDLRDMARIAAHDALPRLLAVAAGQTARLLNVSDLAAPFQLSRTTIREYVTLLARVFLVKELPPWHSNRLSRLVKTPKLHIGDSGLACALLGVDAPALTKNRALLGQVLETFVFQELRRQASWRPEPVDFFHFRDKDGAEVDIVLESGGQCVSGIEVKASATVRNADFHGLVKLKGAAVGQFGAGVVLYDGETTVRFGERLYAVPIRQLWEAPVKA